MRLHVRTRAAITQAEMHKSLPGVNWAGGCRPRNHRERDRASTHTHARMHTHRSLWIRGIDIHTSLYALTRWILLVDWSIPFTGYAWYRDVDRGLRTSLRTRNLDRARLRECATLRLSDRWGIHDTHLDMSIWHVCTTGRFLSSGKQICLRVLDIIYIMQIFLHSRLNHRIEHFFKTYLFSNGKYF